MSLLDLAEVAAATAIAVLAGFFPVPRAALEELLRRRRGRDLPPAAAAGPAAATLAAAGEALVGSWRTSRRWTSRIISPADREHRHARRRSHCRRRPPSSSRWPSRTPPCSAGDDLRGARLLPDQHRADHGRAFSQAQRVAHSGEMFGNFGWVGISVVGSAPIACLLLLAYQQAASPC
jgi:hypothetical protein